MNVQVPTVELAHGAHMPRLGYGTASMADDETQRVVEDALQAGYRLIDTAYDYGNEVGVGRGLAASGIPREELFVTTKLNAKWHGRREAREAFEMATEKLGLDYLDLFLIHWPNPAQDRYVAAYEGLLELLETKAIRAVGVSNFKPAHLDRIIDATGVAPDVNQIQLDPTMTRDAARAYHEAKGIVTESWSPLGAGSGLLDDPAVVALAERHGRTPAQIVLRWHMELGLVTIPKSAHAERIRQNIAIFDFELVPEEIASLSALDQGEGPTMDSDTFGH